jgi:hypothetical protein
MIRGVVLPRFWLSRLSNPDPDDLFEWLEAVYVWDEDDTPTPPTQS